MDVEFDPAGRRVHPDPDDTGCEYRYDALNRTVGVDAASGQTCDTQAAYLHDPLGRQIIDLTGDDIAPADLTGGIAGGWLEVDDAVETHSVFDLLGNDLLATLGWDTTDTTTETDRSVYATGPAGAWATRHVGSATSHGTQVLLTDGRRNTSVVATPGGSQTCARFYGTFGGTDPATTCDTADTANQLWYRGGQQDPVTGSYQYGARHYDPDTATWTTPDTADPHSGLSDLGVGTDPLTNNRYTYVNGNPINTHDPSGHERSILCDETSPDLAVCERARELYKQDLIEKIEQVRLATLLDDRERPAPESIGTVSLRPSLLACFIFACGPSVRTYSEDIDAWATEFGVDRMLLGAIIYHEGGNVRKWDGYNRDAEALGRMLIGQPTTPGIAQVDPETGQRLLDEYFGLSYSLDEVATLLIHDDRFSIALAAAQLADVESRIDPEHRSNANIFTAYAVDVQTILALNADDWDYRAAGYPVALVRHDELWPAARSGYAQARHGSGSVETAPGAFDQVWSPTRSGMI